MKSVVQRVLGEFVDAGRLGKEELDDAAKTVLEKMEAKVLLRGRWVIRRFSCAAWREDSRCCYDFRPKAWNGTLVLCIASPNKSLLPPKSVCLRVWYGRN